jgi:hypothetical protein
LWDCPAFENKIFIKNSHLKNGMEAALSVLSILQTEQ